MTTLNATLSGTASLGRVANANVEIRSLGGDLLATTMTSSDGTFSAQINGVNSGALVVVNVLPAPSSSFRCDQLSGCGAGIAFGDEIDFLVPLRSITVVRTTTVTSNVHFFSEVVASMSEPIDSLDETRLNGINAQVLDLVNALIEPTGSVVSGRVDLLNVLDLTDPGSIPQSATGTELAFAYLNGAVLGLAAESPMTLDNALIDLLFQLSDSGLDEKKRIGVTRAFIRALRHESEAAKSLAERFGGDTYRRLGNLAKALVPKRLADVSMSPLIGERSTNTEGVSGARDFVVLGDRVLFAGEQLQGDKLWSISGVESARIAPDGYPDGLTVRKIVKVGDYAIASVFNGFRYELWRSDGTNEGTELITELPDFVTDIKASEARAFFGIKLGVDVQLWTTDGTETGTRMLLEFPDTLDLVLRGVTGHIAYFYSQTGTGAPVHNRYIDGSSLSPVAQVGGIAHTEAVLSFKDGLLAFGTRARFIRGDQSTELHAGLVEELDLVTPEVAYFRVAGELWQTDGSLAGTNKIGEVEQHLLNNALASTNGVLYVQNFQVRYVNRHTRQDDVLLDLTFGRSFRPLGAAGDKIAFAAESSDGRMWQIWVSDGTAASTRMIGEFPSGSKPQFAGKHTVVNDRAIFSVDLENGDEEVWSTDFSRTGTDVLIGNTAVDILSGRVDNAQLVNSRIFFVKSGVVFAFERGMNAAESLFEGGTSFGSPLITDLAVASAGVCFGELVVGSDLRTDVWCVADDFTVDLVASLAGQFTLATAIGDSLIAMSANEIVRISRNDGEMLAKERPLGLRSVTGQLSQQVPGFFFIQAFSGEDQLLRLDLGTLDVSEIAGVGEGRQMRDVVVRGGFVFFQMRADQDSPYVTYYHDPGTNTVERLSTTESLQLELSEISELPESSEDTRIFLSGHDTSTDKSSIHVFDTTSKELEQIVHEDNAEPFFRHRAIKMDEADDVLYRRTYDDETSTFELWVVDEDGLTTMVTNYSDPNGPSANTRPIGTYGHYLLLEDDGPKIWLIGPEADSYKILDSRIVSASSSDHRFDPENGTLILPAKDTVSPEQLWEMGVLQAE
ncbi:MAG: hypothetical protein ACFHX7_12305 [Pseudomonadota bacterium]